jgi:hypothetical protein
MDMIERAAKVRLKRKNGAGGGMGRKAGAAASQPQMAFAANGQPDFGATQGNVETARVEPNKGWRQDAFAPDGIFARAGLPNLMVVSRHLAEAAVKGDPEAFFDKVSREYNAMPEQQQLNLARRQ